MDSIEDALSKEGVPPPKKIVSNSQGYVLSLKNNSIS